VAVNNDTHDNINDVGYGKPPVQTQFVKGQSGNPKGRPKGSQNPATVLAKAGRQRVKVTENGRSRYVTKAEATVIQLWNKAASGDLGAARVLLSWITSLADPEQATLPSRVPHECDKLVMDNLIERIRKSENVPQDNDAGPMATDPSRKEE
jgi:hypothetical protein